MNESKTGKRNAHFQLPVDLFREMKHEAVRQDLPAAAIFEAACREYLELKARRASGLVDSAVN